MCGSTEIQNCTIFLCRGSYNTHSHELSHTAPEIFLVVMHVEYYIISSPLLSSSLKIIDSMIITSWSLSWHLIHVFTDLFSGISSTLLAIASFLALCPVHLPLVPFSQRHHCHPVHLITPLTRLRFLITCCCFLMCLLHNVPVHCHRVV